MTAQVTVEGVFDALAIRVVLEARKWQGESIESYTARSEDLCYQVRCLHERRDRRLRVCAAKYDYRLPIMQVKVEKQAKSSLG